MQINWLKGQGHKWLSGLWVLLLLAGCESYEKGCMDARATNYKAGNQLPCCCEYPNLVFQTTLTDGEKLIPFTDSIVNDFGQTYIVREMRFLTSGIEIFGTGGEGYSLSDTLGDYEMPPDILALNVRTLNNSGGNILEDGVFSRIHFSLKSIPFLEDKKPDFFSIDHPLRDSTFYDFANARWMVGEVVLGMENGERRTFKYYGDNLNLDINLTGEWKKNLGSNLTVNFKVNITTLFEKMDFSRPEQELRSAFLDALPKAFET